MKIEIERSPRREQYAYGKRIIVSPLSPYAGTQTVIDPQGWLFEKAQNEACEWEECCECEEK